MFEFYSFVLLIEVEEHCDAVCKEQSAVSIYAFFNFGSVKIF